MTIRQSLKRLLFWIRFWRPFHPFRRWLHWMEQSAIADRECERLHAVLSSRYHTDRDLNRALHMADLETKNAKLKEEVRTMQVAAEEHNARNYATGLIVRCTGCESGKPFEGELLSEERVQEVEKIARRLRRWFENHKRRLEREAKGSDQ